MEKEKWIELIEGGVSQRKIPDALNSCQTRVWHWIIKNNQTTIKKINIMYNTIAELEKNLKIGNIITYKCIFDDKSEMQFKQQIVGVTKTRVTYKELIGVNKGGWLTKKDMFNNFCTGKFKHFEDFKITNPFL